LSSRTGRAIATCLNFYVSHATRFLRNGEKCYIYFVDNLLLFPTVKEFPKSADEVIASSDTTFFKHNVYNLQWTATAMSKQDTQLSQKDRAAGCVIVFAKSRTLERGDNDLRIL